ncbi:hypothetical protein ACHAXA_002960 [Cyclostephanos tholiformis]|uniref:Uncharacterized protein n=1 Tax=Cyclostephanos tholiformis TaxID=382380 RepID=A0ABD3RXY6_9STRA
MLQVRGQPTGHAKVGVALFAVFVIRIVHNQTDATSSGPILILLPGAATLISAFFLFVAPIPQPQSYHDFADKGVLFVCTSAATGGFYLPPGAERERAGFIIKNFGDVLSNLVILAGGVTGLALLLNVRGNEIELDPIRKWELRVCLPILFSSNVVISAGSAYYHWNPNDSTLVWDRLVSVTTFAPSAFM